MDDRDKLKIWNMQAYPPRKSWTGRVALGLPIAAVIALWAGVALAETADLGGMSYHICEDDQ